MSPSPSPAPPVAEVRDGAVVLGGRPVLRGIDLAVPQGQFVALMGTNGSGKSTLVRAMTGLLPLARGEARLFGTPVDHFRERQRLGFVPQRAGAASGIPASVAEVVASGRLTRRQLLRPASRADRRAVRDALETVGLADRAGDAVSSLSGGQQQRVLIARALAGEPDLFFLDEPTAGVDLGSQWELAATLSALAERGSTVLLVAHELGPLAPLVERTVVLRDGRVAHDGAPLPAHEAVTAQGPLDHDDHHHHGHHHEHHYEAAPHDHAPHVAGPLEAP